MGNNSSNEPLYHPNLGIVLDVESANNEAIQKKAKNKSISAISPLPSLKEIPEKKETQNENNFQKILHYCQENNSLYQDPDFPPENKIISDNFSAFLPFLNPDQVFWQRADQIFLKQKFSVFQEDIIPNDIQQGMLGDCYFLSALAALAERPNLIKFLFETKETNFSGCYCVRLCIDGKWEKIIIDDFFPVVKKENSWSFIFSRSNGPELWVLLLEKAYAKVYGSYQKIENGLCSEALRDLTGASTIKISDFSEEKAWDFMTKAKEKNFLIVAASEFENQTAQSGIVSAHCYSVLDLKIVSLKENNEERIIKLRNPWGHKEWTGDWSDDSDKWTPELRKNLEVTSKDDGIFWMNIKDFCSYYSEINVCQVHEGWKYFSKEIFFTEKAYQIITFEVKNTKNLENSVDLTINQNDKRKNSGKFSYSYIRMLICKFEKKEVFLLEENSGRMRNLQISLDNLNSGIYIIYLEVEPNKTKEKFVLSSYGNNSIQFNEINVEREYFFESLFLNYINSCQDKEKIIHKYEENIQIQKITARIADYIFIYYLNDSENYGLKEEIEFLESNNFVCLNSKPIEKKYEILVKPKSKFFLNFKTKLEFKNSFATFKNQATSLFVWESEIEKMALEALRSPYKVMQRKMNDNLIAVFVYIFYKAGILGFLYQNKTDKVYKEAAHFLTKNLKSVNFDQENLKISLEPNETFYIYFEVIDQSLEVYYKLSYVPIIY